MTLRRLVLLRHGQTAFNVEGRMQGHLDSQLTALGRAQAAAVAPVIAALGPDRLISSDLRRAIDTAEVVAAAAGLDVKVVALDRRRGQLPLGVAGAPGRAPAVAPGGVQRERGPRGARLVPLA